MTQLFHNLRISEISRALCLTFLHSLWQGLLLALLAAFFILLSPKARPRLRYNMLALLFTGFIAAVVYTFAGAYQQQNACLPSLCNSGSSGTSSGTNGLYDFWNNTVRFMNIHAGSLAVVWLLVFSFKSFRLLQDISGIKKLRETGSAATDIYWINKLQDLKSRLNIRGTISLKESASLISPSVSGILKPVIFLPLGMLTQLPPDQVEAILLHELAHIRRKDYLFNLVQTFTEMVFFFNPFLCWLSALLRTERENCCDEIALNISRDKAALVRALISFGEMQQAIPGNLAMALGSKRTLLLDRVKRITFDKNKSLNGAEKSFLALFSIAILTFLCTFSWNVQQQLNGKAVKPGNQLLQWNGQPSCDQPANTAPQLQPIDNKNKATANPRISKVTQHGALQTISHTETRTATITTVNELPGTDTLALSRNIITDLEKEGAIAAIAQVRSYLLSNEELIVNGVKQPESLHRKLKSKYVKSAGWAILYDFHSSNVSIPLSVSTNIAVTTDQFS
jgi:beta-lactamase regulating signal transducer with metallopeptidase domain